MLQQYSGFAKVLLAMLIWGSVGIFVRYADQPATTIVFVRVAAAFAALCLYTLFRRSPIKLKGSWGLALLSGVVISLNWLLFFKAIQTTTIGNAVLTYYLAPIFSILWARLFLGEYLERRAFYALMLALTGVILMLSGYEFSLASQHFLGILYGLGGAIFYSMVTVLVKHISAPHPTDLVLVQMAVASVVFFPFITTAPALLTWPSLAVMVTMGLFHSALALGLYFTGLKTVKVQHASILSYVDPMSALIYAYLFFGEKPSLYTAYGGLCILLASYLVIAPGSNSHDHP